MIKTNELRIGNKVLNDKGFEMEVMAIFKDEVYLDFEGNQGDWWEEKQENIYPVYLTEELMLSIGFKYNTPCKTGNDLWKDMGYWYSKGIVLRGDKKCENQIKLDGLYDSNFQHLHHIQNIYFELNKEELKLN